MHFEIFFLGLIICCVTFIPIGYILYRLVNVYNNQTKEKRPRLHGQIAIIGLSATMLLGLYTFAHNDTYIGLDTSCYKQLAVAFSEDGRELKGVDAVYQSIPNELRKSFLYRPDGRLTRDRIFEINDVSCEIEPFFLPMLSLGAAIFPDVDFFVPFCGALWFALLIAFGLCKGGFRGLLLAIGCFFATFWPMWFLRGFYTEALGAILVCTGLLATLMPVLRERKLDIFVIGFVLGCSVGYHFTMVVPAGIVALYLLLTNGWTFRRQLLLVLGGAVGLIPMLYQLIFVCTPYGNILSLSAFIDMFSEVREIRFLTIALLLAIIVFAGVSSIILNKRVQPKIQELLRKHTKIINPICIVLSALVWMLYVHFAGPISVGFSTIQSGVVYALPLIIFVAILLSASRDDESVNHSALALMLSLMAALFIYIKGVEVHVGLWSQRRFLPVIIIFIPLFIVALCGFKGNGKTKFLPYGLLMISIVPMFRWPAAYIGVFGASVNEENGRPSITAVIDDFIEKNNNVGKTIFIFDYFPHSVPFQHDLNRCVLGVGEHAQWNYPEIVQWAFETTKTNQAKAFFISSYGTPILEESVAMQPIRQITDELEKYTTKGVFPVVYHESKAEIKKTICLMGEPTRDSIQCVSFMNTLYPFGLRQPWGRTTKYGTWSRQGSGIVGPIPENGGKVLISISAMWAPPVSDGSWQDQNLIIESPFGVKSMLQISATNEFGIYSCEIERTEEDDFGDSVTGVYRFYVEKPYDPSLYGTKGFDSDLGVIFKNVSIQCIK